MLYKTMVARKKRKRQELSLLSVFTDLLHAIGALRLILEAPSGVLACKPESLPDGTDEGPGKLAGAEPNDPFAGSIMKQPLSPLL